MMRDDDARFRHPYAQLDMGTWKRRGHFRVFGHGDYPYVGVTARVDMGDFDTACRAAGARFFDAFLFAVTTAVNAVENFRYRILDGVVVLCQSVDPSFTIMDREEDLFYFGYATAGSDYYLFADEVARAKETAVRDKDLSGGRQDVFYVSSLPWLDFTDLIQPLGLSKGDSVPRLVWGKKVTAGGRTTMPLSVTGHHGLMDGLHLARFFQILESILHHPEFLSSAADR